MATCRDTITRALQMSKVVALGVTPKAKEADFGMEILQSIYDQMVINGAFGKLNDVLATADYTALENDRIRHTSSETITYPTSYGDDGEEGDDRQPYDLSIIETFNTTTSARTVKLWDRDSWVTLTGLALADEAPLSKRGELGLSALLAENIAGSFGVEIPTSVARLAAGFRFGLSYKLGSDRPARTAEYF